MVIVAGEGRRKGNKRLGECKCGVKEIGQGKAGKNKMKQNKHTVKR